jgi:dolichol-phosphate mannosyltransferase
MSSPRVLCIAPAWNEGERIRRVVSAVPKSVVTQTLVVDDGSTDQTASFAEGAGAIVLRMGTNQGVGNAIRAGIDYGRQHGFDIAVIVSGGGKTPPQQIPQLLAPLLDGTADFVQGSRYVKGGERKRMPLKRILGTRAYSMLFSMLLGKWVADASSGFRAFRLSLLQDSRINLWQPWLNRYELEPYLLFQAIRFGYRVAEVAVTIEYPPKTDRLAYSKMRAIVDWWKIFRPALFLRMRLRA